MAILQSRKESLSYTDEPPNWLYSGKIDEIAQTNGENDARNSEWSGKESD